MDYGPVLETGRQGMTVGLMVMMPLLAVALTVGLVASIFQAVTQVQEATLTYVPKVIGAIAVCLAMGGWMLSTLVKFTVYCFELAGRSVGAG